MENPRTPRPNLPAGGKPGWRERWWRLSDRFHLWWEDSGRPRARRFQRWFFRWQTDAMIAVLLTTIALIYQYGVPSFRNYWDQRYAQKAEKLLAQGDLNRAMLCARIALDWNPNDATATRVIAELADSFGAPEAFFWRERALQLKPADNNNRMALASTALRVEAFPFPTASKIVSTVEPNFQQNASYQRVAGVLAFNLSHFQEAEQHFQQALWIEPNNVMLQLSLAAVRLQSKNPEVVKDAQSVLESLRSNPQVGVLATRSLISEKILHTNYLQAEAMSYQILTNASCSFNDYLTHLTILNASHSTNFQPFLAATQLRAKNSVANVGELAAWMNNAGLAQSVQDWFAQLPPQFSQAGYLAVTLADAYVALAQWAELEKYLERRKWTDLEHIRFAMIALAEAKQLRPTLDSVAWENAKRAAAGSLADVKILVKLATAWGWNKRAEELVAYAAQKYPNDPWPAAKLSEIYAARQDTAGLWQMAQLAYQQNPMDKLGANNYAMLSLLLDKNGTDADAIAVQQYQNAPLDPIYASTYAFSLYKRGRTKDALTTFRNLGNEELEKPATAVYYGIVLAASGEVAAARHFLDKADETFLLPEERVLVERAKNFR